MSARPSGRAPPSRLRRSSLEILEEEQKTKSKIQVDAVKKVLNSAKKLIAQLTSKLAGVPSTEKLDNRLSQLKPGKMRLRNSSTSRVSCARQKWSCDSLLRFALTSVKLSSFLSITWSRGDGPLAKWEGQVMGKKNDKWMVRYSGQVGLFPFPPHGSINVHAVSVLNTSPHREWLLKLRREAHVGDQVSLVFSKNGVRGRWSGVILAMGGHGGLRIRYAPSGLILPFPPPRKAEITVHCIFVESGAHLLPSAVVLNRAAKVVQSVVTRADPPHVTTSRNQKRSCETKLIATLNCRSLKSVTSQRGFEEWMSSREIDYVGLQETRLEALQLANRHCVSAPCSSSGAGGLAFVSKVEPIVQSKTFQDNTVLMAVVENTAIFVVLHAPHAGHTRLHLEDWWRNFGATTREIFQLRSTMKHPLPVIALGDMNARVITRDAKKTFKQRRNITSTLLTDHCEEFRLVVANGLFEKSQSKLMTFSCNNRKAQLDCILIEKRWRSSAIDCYAMNPPIPSDHRALMMKFKLRVKALKRTTSISSQVSSKGADYSLLSRCVESRSSEHMYLEAMAVYEGYRSFIECRDFTQEYPCELLYELRRVTLGLEVWARTFPEHIPVPLDEFDTHYSDFASAQRRASSILPRRPTVSKWQAWDLEERCKARQRMEWSRVSKSFAAEDHFNVDLYLAEFSRLQTSQPAAAWKRIEALTQRTTQRCFPSRSSDAEILEHFRSINGVPKPVPVPRFRTRLKQAIVNTKAFTWKELDDALHDLQNGKANGVDEMPAEVLKLRAVRELLLKYANEYLQLQTPMEVLMTQLAMVPKKGDLSVVQNYRPVCLVSTFLKLVDRLFLNRLRPLDSFLRTGQNGFRPARGTMTHAMTLQMLLERSQFQGLSFVATFVDFSNAFPSVSHVALRSMLRTWLISDAFIDAIMQCYTHHKVVIDLPSGQVSYAVETGILQGDTLAPYLFVMLLDAVLDHSLTPGLGLPLVPPTRGTTRTRAFEDYQRERNSKYLTELAFADDLIILTPNCLQGQMQFQNLQSAARDVGLEVNFKKGKTEYVCCNTPIEPILNIDGVALVNSTTYTYLGTNPFDLDASFASRKQKAWLAIHKLDCVWTNPSVSIPTRLQLLNTFVTTIFQYGAVCWPRTRDWTTLIDWTFKKMIRYVTRQWYADEPTLYNNGQIPHLSTTLLHQRLSHLGHALRHEQPLGILAQHTYGSQRTRGGQKLTLDTDFCRLLPLPREDWDILASNRHEWRDYTNLTAAEFEDDHWRRYWKARRARWLSYERIERRTYLRILEAAIFPGLPWERQTRCDPAMNLVLDTKLHPFVGAARSNGFRRCAS